MRASNLPVKRLALLLLATLMVGGGAHGFSAELGSCAMFPADNIWNARVDTLPIDSNSTLYVTTIGTNTALHPDFGSGDYPPGSGFPIGIPYMVLPGTTALVNVTFDYDGESDPGPYPIPPNPLIEGGPNGDGDRHILMVDSNACRLYELFSAYPNTDGTWTAGSGAIFDLNSNVLRPDTWTSADAAGLPILPGLVRYDEAASGVIAHAIRFTAPKTRHAYVWPGRHQAATNTPVNFPPMGQRFRLRADYSLSGFSPISRTILVALQRYGMILADNGGPWFISGVPDERWDNDVVGELKRVKGRDFEALDSSGLMADPDSGAVQYPRPQIDAIAITSNTAALTISNLFPGAAYTLERAEQLVSNAWTASPPFVSDATATNLQDDLAIATTTYYRVTHP